MSFLTNTFIFPGRKVLLYNQFKKKQPVKYAEAHGNLHDNRAASAVMGFGVLPAIQQGRAGAWKLLKSVSAHKEVTLPTWDSPGHVDNLGNMLKWTLEFGEAPC